jgi:hypothetical protein
MNAADTANPASAFLSSCSLSDLKLFKKRIINEKIKLAPKKKECIPGWESFINQVSVSSQFMNAM